MDLNEKKYQNTPTDGYYTQWHHIGPKQTMRPHFQKSMRVCEKKAYPFVLTLPWAAFLFY